MSTPIQSEIFDFNLAFAPSCTNLPRSRVHPWTPHCRQTDFDLTGQVIWPISVYMGWFVARNRSLFAGKRVVELGAGCGLSGLVASQFAAATALTDGNDVVLRLLERNAEAQRGRFRCGRDGIGAEFAMVAALAEPVAAGAADAGAAGAAGSGVTINAAAAAAPTKSEATAEMPKRTAATTATSASAAAASAPGALAVQELMWGDATSLERHLAAFGPPEVLLGADVVCWPAFVEPFLLTVKALLQVAPRPADAALYLGYVCRAASVTRQFHTAATELGLRVEAVGVETFLPEALSEATIPENVRTSCKLKALRVTLDLAGNAAAAAEAVRWPDDGGAGGDTIAAPC
ncbi:unnamed protein product [Phaeothamnion confervicola]